MVAGAPDVSLAGRLEGQHALVHPGLRRRQFRCDHYRVWFDRGADRRRVHRNHGIDRHKPEHDLHVGEFKGLAGRGQPCAR